MRRRAKVLAGVLSGVLILLIFVVFFMKENLRSHFWHEDHRQDVPLHPLTQATGGTLQGTLRPGPQVSSTNISSFQRHMQKLENALATANVPVNFWGQVVDQDNQPIPGARIQLMIRRLVATPAGVADGATSSLVRSTDANGRFSILGEYGDYMQVDLIEKNGYVLSDSATKAFRYSGLESDPSTFKANQTQPIVYRMWKRRGAEPMSYRFIGRLGIPCDGTSVRIDLVTGRKVSLGGDLQVTLVREPLHIQRGKQHYDWTATFSAEGGGLIETTNEFMYVAPERGYQPSLKIGMAADNPHWKPEAGMEFYLMSQNGKHFARMRVLLDTGYEPPPTGLTIEVWLNPNGSRNLEYDPAKRIGFE